MGLCAFKGFTSHNRPVTKLKTSKKVKSTSFFVFAVNKMKDREIILSKEEQVQELLARAKSSNYLNSPYKCNMCFKGFVDLRAYDNHKEKHDEVCFITDRCG